MRLIEENNHEEEFLCLHITRGAADRDYRYSGDLSPNVFVFTQEQAHQRADDPPRAITCTPQPICVGLAGA
jgi:D-alanine transaminase